MWLTSHPRSTVALLDTGTPGTSREIYSEDGNGQTRTRNPWITNPVLQPLSYTAQKLLLARSWVYPVGVLYHYIFIFSQLWLTSHPTGSVALLDTGTPGTSREIYSEDGNGQTRTRNPWITNPVLQPLSYIAQKLLLARIWVYPVGVLYHYIFIFSQLWLTSHPTSTVALLVTGTPGTRREIYSDDANGEPPTCNPWIRNRVRGVPVSSRATVLLGWEVNHSWEKINI